MADLLRQGADLCRHRGPDDAGSWQEGGTGLSHRRLSILDLSPLGHQPMEFGGRYHISYNGEIYNYLELRGELERLGVTFRSRTDTEVAVAAYSVWGPNCVQRFNGMWALAIFDRAEQRLFCSRDRFGVKPLYYHLENGELVIASEMKQFAPFLRRNRLNRELCAEYLVAGFLDHRDGTFLQGIRKLPGGHNLTFDVKSRRFEVTRWYDIQPDRSMAALGEKEAIELLRETLESSIELRLRSDVRVGTCLSGGLDSSSVAVLAAKRFQASTGERFTAIHARGEVASADESEFARLVARHGNIDLHLVTPTYEEFRDAVDDVVRCQEEPFGATSVFMQYFVMQKARELDCKVMLDGQGGDEVFLGYEKYYPAVYLDYLRRSPWQGLREIMASSRNHQTMRPAAIAKYSVGAFVASARNAYHHQALPFLKNEARDYLTVLNEISRSYWNVFQLQKLEIERTNLPVLLRYEDRDSMIHSVEARLPLLDYRLVELGLSLKTEHKVRSGWTKYALRKATEGVLPPEITWRKDKFGFNSPHRRWMRKHAGAAKEELRKSAILAQFCDMEKLLESYDQLEPRSKWRFYNTAVWERVCGVEL